MARHVDVMLDHYDHIHIILDADKSAHVACLPESGVSVQFCGLVDLDSTLLTSSSTSCGANWLPDGAVTSGLRRLIDFQDGNTRDYATKDIVSNS